MDSGLSIKNASGKTFSLLNDNTIIAPFKVNKLTSSLTTPASPKRKYHCLDPGCNKSFTTSGHLARHNRIHTGEKNFHCLHPGCPSRFSRQDNMMQHYRTHLSQKIRRPHVRPMQTKKSDTKKPVTIMPELHHHAYYGNEHETFFQPLTRPRRATTMPSLPHPDMLYTQHNRPRRTQSTSFPTFRIQLPPPQLQDTSSNTQQKPLTDLLSLTNIVSSFG